MKNIFVLVISLLFTSSVLAEEPILIIGASFANATTPINDNLDAPLGGIAVGLGSFLSLGNALVRNRSLSGHVINEAQAGATTFDRIGCNPVCTPGVSWQGYDKQFTKALARVTVPGTGGSVNIGKYVVITIANDCLHSDAFGVEQANTTQCTTAELNQFAERLIAVGQRIVDAGLTPIYTEPPTYDKLDMALFPTLAGLNWAIDEATYNEMQTIRRTRIANELPEAVQLVVWDKFEHLGDGLHPTDHSVVHAAKRIAQYITNH